MIPAPAMKQSLGRGEECTHQRVRGQDADQSWRNWRHDYQRRLKRS